MHLGKAFGFHRTIRKPPADEARPTDCDASKDEEKQLPRVDFVVEIMRRAPRNNSPNLKYVFVSTVVPCCVMVGVWVDSKTYHELNSGHTVPQRRQNCLFSLGILKESV